MDEKELLTEANNRYPQGTKFRSAFSRDIYTLDSDLHLYSGGVRSKQRSEPWIYYNREWAEIVSLPKSEIINNYSIY